MYEIFEKLLKEHNLTAYKVAKDTGLTTATLTNWKKGRYTPKQDKLQKIAEYFGVSLEYLTTGKEPATDWKPTFTEKDEKDLDKKVEDLLNAVDTDTGLMLDGQVMDDEKGRLLQA